MKTKTAQFPKRVYVTVDQNDDSDHKEKGLLAWRDSGEGIEHDGPTTIAVYELRTTMQLKRWDRDRIEEFFSEGGKT